MRAVEARYGMPATLRSSWVSGGGFWPAATTGHVSRVVASAQARGREKGRIRPVLHAHGRASVAPESRREAEAVGRQQQALLWCWPDPLLNTERIHYEFYRKGCEDHAHDPREDRCATYSNCSYDPGREQK